MLEDSRLFLFKTLIFQNWKNEGQKWIQFFE